MSEQVVYDEALHTFLVENERILNNHPLVRNEGDVYDLDPLTPNKLLLLRSNSCLPPGQFVLEGQGSGVNGGQEITRGQWADGCGRGNLS
jgi:hypothetical protein